MIIYNLMYMVNKKIFFLMDRTFSLIRPFKYILKHSFKNLSLIFLSHLNSDTNNKY